ncbi:MAG: glycerol-3-phosphate dehydrogenase/oxidase [Pseudomonadota bacterium]
MWQRDISSLKERTFDVLVVGGGIYGAWTALDGALRGLSVALIDMADWASATSSASTKLIHGGLRYLEQLRLDLVHTSLEERRRLVALAPHMVTPLSFVMPDYQENRVGPLKLKTGLFLYDLLAGSGQPVPGHQRLNRAQMAESYPFLAQHHLRGGFVYGDCQTDDFRLAMTVVRAAAEAGAVTANYVKAASLVTDVGEVAGASVTDRVSGERFTIRSRMVVNTAGPWVAAVEGSRRKSDIVRYSKGVHLVLPALPTREAFLLMTHQDNRIFFLVPWYGRTLVGTTDADYDGDPGRLRVTQKETDYLLREMRPYLPDMHWDADAVLGGFAGLRTLKNEPGKPPSQVSREWLFTEPRSGLITSIGGKYTSARADAAKLVDRVIRRLDRSWNGEAPTFDHLLPGAPVGDFGQWRKQALAANRAAGMDADTSAWSIFRFGTEVTALQALMAAKPPLAARLVPDLPFSRAEMVHAARTEMVVHLEDLVRRRIPLVILSHMDTGSLEDAAHLAAPELGWDAARVAVEIAAVQERWGIGRKKPLNNQ